MTLIETVLQLFIFNFYILTLHQLLKQSRSNCKLLGAVGRQQERHFLITRPTTQLCQYRHLYDTSDE